jgi:hypothetical protein
MSRSHLLRRTTAVLSHSIKTVRKAAHGPQGRRECAAACRPRLEQLEVRDLLSATYDIALHFAYVGSPGNASVAVDGFSPPSNATVPSPDTTSAGYQLIGGVPYMYAIGQTEITAAQYTTFLNKVDPNGDNPAQPVTGIHLWEERFSPVLNPFSGQINRVINAPAGEHYQLAASFWADKPLVNDTLFDFAYFDNSLYNGTTVAIDNSTATSPLGFTVQVQTRYISLSTNITTGMYDMADASYLFFQRQDLTGYVIPSDNEWVKAAYYTPTSTGNGTQYFYYPTNSNSPPNALTTSGPEATVDSLGNVMQANLTPGVAYSNFNLAVNWQPPYDSLPSEGANVVSVGEDQTPGPWLTYDQGGNAVEWTDTPFTLVPGVANPENVPVFFKVHGGVANATTYQLWLTATGTSDPYGQALGQIDKQAGARFGYVPNLAADALIGTSASVLPSALATPLTSNLVVYRVDNTQTLATFYTTDLAKAVSLMTVPTSVFLGANFQEATGAGALPVYGFLNSSTQTQFYTIDPNAATVASANPAYTSEGVVFSAFPAGVGNTNFRQFYNATTGAYADSAADVDVQIFTSRGYTLDGIGWSATEPDPADPAQISANTIYVSNVYELLLHRAPDGGADFWVNSLNNGATPSSVVLGVEASAEYLQDQVVALYLRYLNRAADAAGEQYWTTFLQAGGTFEEVSAGLASSQEYFQEQGNTNQGFVMGLYSDVLGRTATSAEVDAWVALLNTGTSRATVATAFLTSNEYYSDLVMGDYRTYLGRPAEAAGLQAWLQAIRSGMSDQQVLASIFGSQEGFDRWS